MAEHILNTNEGVV